MKIHHLLLLHLVVFQSCNQAPAKETAKTSTSPPLQATVTPIPAVQAEKEPVPTPKELTAEDTSLTLTFPELTLNINRFIVYEEDQNGYKGVFEKDTVVIYTELGETVEGQTITITSEVLTDIAVEQQYETSVTIMDEGPHCDLTSWKHYTSGWVKLPAKGAGVFTAKKYTPKERVRFPEVAVAALRAAVQKECGDEWVRLIRKVKSVQEYPSGVDISRIYLRVSGKRKNTGEAVQKMLLIEVPMGC